MSSLSQVLSSFAVPLQVWLSPDARGCAATPLIDTLGGRAQIHTQPLSSLDTLKGPAVLVLTAREITGSNADRLRLLADRAYPGRAVLIGGTEDRDTLMAGINDWGVIRVVPSAPTAEQLLSAVSDAETNLKREVALETAIDDLDIENTMLASAIDQLEGGLDRDQPATTSGAITTFAAGLAAVLEREAERLKDASTEDSRIQGACEGLSLLAGLVDKAHDRAIESRAGLPVSPEPLDALIDAVKTLITLQGGERMSGHIGSGVTVAIEPLALVHQLMALTDRGPCGSATTLEAYRAGSNAVIELRYPEPVDDQIMTTNQETAAWPILAESGVTVAVVEADPLSLRLLIPTAEESHE